MSSSRDRRVSENVLSLRGFKMASSLFEHVVETSSLVEGELRPLLSPLFAGLYSFRCRITSFWAPEQSYRLRCLSVKPPSSPQPGLVSLVSIPFCGDRLCIGELPRSQSLATSFWNRSRRTTSGRVANQGCLHMSVVGCTCWHHGPPPRDPGSHICCKSIGCPAWGRSPPSDPSSGIGGTLGHWTQYTASSDVSGDGSAHTGSVQTRLRCRPLNGKLIFVPWSPPVFLLCSS